MTSVLTTTIFLASYFYGSWKDLKTGKIFDLVPLTSIAALILLVNGSLLNAFTLAGIGLVLNRIQLMGFADVEYLFLSGTFLHFLPLHHILLGMSTTVYFHNILQTKEEKTRVKLIPVLLLGTLNSLLIYLTL